MFLGSSESSAESDKRLGMTGVNQCALLCYTSGTTGNPKGKIIILCHTSGTTGNPKGKNKLFMPHTKNYWQP